MLLDTVSADGTLFAAANGVTTTGAGGTVRLQASGVSQTAAGIVTSDLLGVQNGAAGNVILDQPNVVNTFAAANPVGGGRITVRTAGAVTLGDVTAQGTFAAVSGITTPAGTAFVQAGGNIGQTATGLVIAPVFGVRGTGTIRLDQPNAVATFAANDTLAGGLVNFRTTGALTLDTVASGSALLTAVAGVVTTTNGTALLRAANGVSQTAAGLVNSATLAVRNDTAGNINLVQTNYTTLTGNQVGTFAAVNAAPTGQVNLSVLGDLTIGTVAADGTFASVRGITTNNGNATITTGRNFTAADPNFASPLVTLGTGLFQVNPGQTAGAVVIFNAEVSAQRATFGTVPPRRRPRTTHSPTRLTSGRADDADYG